VDARRVEVQSVDDEVRLDSLLAREFELSRRYVRRLLASGRVRVNGVEAVKGTLLHPSDVVDVEPFRHPSEGPIAHLCFEPVLLSESGDLIAVDKPAGRATHPLDYDETDTVLNAMLARFPEIRGVGEGGLMSGVAHRLDTHTSGVLVFARSQRAWEHARREFDSRSVDKLYRARVHGDFAAETESRLRLEHRGPRMRVVKRGGRESITRLRPLDSGSESSLVEARPVTGLMHQIRVALAELGHPVVGDTLYGSSQRLERHWLHAVRIRIGEFSAESEPPPELR